MCGRKQQAKGFLKKKKTFFGRFETFPAVRMRAVLLSNSELLAVGRQSRRIDLHGIAVPLKLL